MKTTILTAVSAIAIMSATPALAENATKSVKPGSEAAANASTGSVTKDVKNAWKDTKEDVSNATESISEAAKDTYNDVKQALSDDDDQAKVMSEVTIAPNKTAEGMIGETVFNTNGDRVAKIHDIILDESGQAVMVVMADGGFTGLGKLVAFDYDIITSRSSEGDVIASLSEKMMDSGATFSYDRSEFSDSVRVMPDNGFSVAELLDGELVNPQGKTLAEVDNIVFRNAQATQVIVRFGQTFGMGGQQAALSYSEADLTRNGDSVDFKLSANEALDFKAYTETALN